MKIYLKIICLFKNEHIYLYINKNIKQILSNVYFFI